MGFMQRFERKLEDAVGNTFARVFGGKIVPAEVEDALHREAAHGLQNLNGHALAPNHYVLTVSETDEASLTSDTELTLHGFAKHLTGYIGEQGWETYGEVSVALESSPDLHTGQFRARSVISPDDASSIVDPHAGGPAPAAIPHSQPGATQMPSEPQDAPQPRYQPQPEPQRYQQQAYSAGQYQAPVPPEELYGQPPAQGYPPRPPADQPYPGPPDPRQRYPEQQDQQGQQPEYPAAQYSQPEPPVQAYSQQPPPGESFPHRQRYGYEQYPDPRFQPPAHLYPPQQPPAPRPPVPQQQPEGPPPDQYPDQYPQPAYGYQDQAYPGREYPLRDPAADYYSDDRYAAPTAAVLPQQAWTAQGPTVLLELGDGSGRNLELRRGSNIIGRGQDAHFRIPDTGVSRQHADIQWDGAVALIVDLQSTNGTVVNDTPVNEWQLADGDVIRIGHSDITVRFL